MPLLTQSTIFYALNTSYRPRYPAAMPADLKDLLTKMLDKDQEKRINMADILVTLLTVFLLSESCFRII